GLTLPPDYYRVILTGSASPNSQGLKARWTFNEGAGTVAGDSSGNGYTGTLNGGASWTPGVNGSAVTLDGVSAFVSTGFTQIMPQWTVSLWARSPQAPNSNEATGPVQYWGVLSFDWNHPQSAFRSAVEVSIGTDFYPASFGALAGNTWYHLVG